MVKHLLIILLLLGSLGAIAQGRTVTGKVTSATEGSGLPGVTVVVKGTTNGTTTGVNGDYSLTLPNATTDVTLTFSFVGMSTQDVAVGNRSVVNVTMAADARQLSEVVVTGYTTQNRREVSGAVAIVTAEEIANVPLGSFDQALQGKAPGILVQANSGQPGAAANVRIRGRGSINGGTNPLYVLDGIEISAGDFATLNPSDFESFSILKDAVSTAPYGSRGANGVVVITSKKGIAGKTRLSYDAQTGFSTTPENRLRLMNSSEKIDYELSRGNPYKWTPRQADSLRNVNTDWADVFFKTGKTNTHTLSASGGTDKTTFFLSGSIFDQTGTVPTTKLERYTGRANVQSSAGNFNFGVNSTFGYSDFTNTSEENSGIATPLNAIRWTNPYETPYDQNGKYTEMISGQPNALQSLLENTNLRQQLKGVGNIYVAYKLPFLSDLTLKTNWGGDFTSNETSTYIDPSTPFGASSTGGKGSFGRGYARSFRYTGTTSATYARNFGADHSLSIGLYNEIVKFKGNNFNFTGFGLGGPFENEAGITPGTAINGFIPVVGGNGGENALLSYFTLVNYGFKERYFLTLGGRRDGSSRFGANRKYANFGSVGLSWVVSDESFMVPLENIFNQLKFKVSYGSAGNQEGIGNFQSRELYGRSFFNGAPGLLQTQLENPDIQWERKTTFNTGIELATLNGRLRSTIEYYNSLTSDLFLNRQLSRTTGYNGLTSNIGELENKGVEFSLEGDIIKTVSGFTWSANVSLTHNQNKVKKLVTDQDIINGSFILREGESANSLFLVRYAGVNPDNGNARYLTKEGETTEVYSPKDRVIVGQSEVPFYGGFGSSLGFKGFEASAFFSFVRGNEIYNNDRNNVTNPAYYFDNMDAALINEWKKAGDITDVPRPGNAFRSGTTRFVESGDFLRLRNVNVSYTLPKSIASAVKLNTLRIFAQGQNLKTWTDFLGWDPEITNGSLTGAQYPALRTITFGVNVGI